MGALGKLGKIAMLSLAFILIQAVITPLSAANPFLVDTLQEGDEAIILSSGLPYRLKLVNVADTTSRAVFSLNGEYSRALRPRERYTFSDGSILALGNILPNEGIEINGKDIVEYYFIGSGRLASSGMPDTSRRFTTALAEQFDLEYDLSPLEEEGPLQPSTPRTDSSALMPACTSDTDCDDGNGCTTDTCMGTPRACTHQASMPGCSFGRHYCVPYLRSYLIPPDSGVYCSPNGTWIEQQQEQQPCAADYECISGLCTNTVCTLPGARPAPAGTIVSQAASPANSVPAEAPGQIPDSSTRDAAQRMSSVEKLFLFLLALFL